MMNRKGIFRWMVLTLIAAAIPATARAHGLPRPGRIEVMTRNLYIGADVFRIAEARTDAEVPAKVAEILAIVEASLPEERLDAVAAEIAKRKPELVGLQEVYRFDTQFPGDVLIGNPTPATEPLFDYLELLLAALERRGLDYRVAASIDDTDVELPAIAGFSDGQPLFMDVRVLDRDVILARGDVETANPLSLHYTFNAPLPVGGQEVASLRGLTAVDAWSHGRRYRFVNTHLEVDFEGPALVFQSLQTQELIGILDTSDDPVILVGDFNSGPDHPPVVDGIVSPYRRLLDAGYADAWAIQRGRVRGTGATCCHAELLDNEEPTLDRRVDLVWLRSASGVGPTRAVVVGDETRDRTPSGRWPSDHAGVVVRTHLRRAP